MFVKAPKCGNEWSGKRAHSLAGEWWGKTGQRGLLVFEKGPEFFGFEPEFAGGLRGGEVWKIGVCLLKRKDVDREDSEIVVCGRLIRGQGKGRGEGEMVW